MRDPAERERRSTEVLRRLRLELAALPPLRQRDIAAVRPAVDALLDALAEWVRTGSPAAGDSVRSSARQLIATWTSTTTGQPRTLTGATGGGR